MAATKSTGLPLASPRVTPGRDTLIDRIVRHWSDYLYIAPAILVMLLVIGYPLVYTIYLSFFRTPATSAAWVFNGIHNYTNILTDRDFWSITKNTMYWTIFSTIGSFVLGFGAALVLNRAFLGRGLLRGLLLIPWVISAVPAAYIWRWLLHSDYGLISAFLIRIHVIDQPLILLDSTRWVLPALIVTNVWKEFPFAMIMMLAGLQTVPDQLLRAARVDGANVWNQFWHVTVPHLKSVILITTLLIFVGNLNSFTLVWIMTGGGPAGASQLWITEIYSEAFQSLNFGRASAFSVILFLAMAAAGWYYVKALTGGNKRRPT